MWLGLLLIVTMAAMATVAACLVAGRATKREEMDEYVDRVAADLLKDIELNL